MLDTDTKRRIDTARDILVGKVPDPKSQVEQITIALIYKFMDDMDAENEEWGGEREFFAGDFEQYRWANLVRGGLGGHEMLNRYAEAITRMPENPRIPPLFRGIFNNAFLPYRDPETLRLFLREIDGFEYSDSEALGDAFEYLLSVLGSQGDAGQFRTPRHVIDFIVGILDPKKDESVLDPACGTAGFLISAWKHILNANADGEGGSTLTPDERERLARNFTGYDISPDMVRLSLVNMYLHGFADPRIYEYDTLTSEERWDVHADVILANPPFMNPKGGIRPHKRFSVQSTRSEVLFVDYMAEHLTPNGRAGIIVPAGIIFQTQSAHTRLRKMLVQDYLVAVVSLPAGVFNPYSGVKTSILILDKALARRTNTVAFFKVENDGRDLGAQRREIEADDLPVVHAEIAEYLRRARAAEGLEGYESGHGFAVAKSRIAEGDDYNLSAERYRKKEVRPTKWPMVRLGEACEVKKGNPIIRKDAVDGPIPIIAAGQQPSGYHNKFNREGETITVSASGAYAGFVAYFDEPIFASDCSTISCNGEQVLPRFLFRILKYKQDSIYELQVGMGQPHVYPKDIADLQVPLPPLDVQRELVAEIEGYQRVIDGARAVLDGYRPHVPVDPSWPLVRLGNADLFDVRSGGTPSSDVKEYWDGGIPWITLVDLPADDFISEIHSTQRTISKLGMQKSSAKIIPENSVVVSSRATIGRIGITRIPLATNQGFRGMVIRDPTRIVPEYLAMALKPLVPTMIAWATGGTFKEISKTKFCELEIPLPPLEAQSSIVAELQAEQALVEANRELITRMESRIASAIGRVWGEE